LGLLLGTSVSLLLLLLLLLGKLLWQAWLHDLLASSQADTGGRQDSELL
jgi:hypothetical protein